MTDFQNKFFDTVNQMEKMTDAGRELYCETLTLDDLPLDLVNAISKCIESHERISLDSVGIKLGNDGPSYDKFMNEFEDFDFSKIEGNEMDIKNVKIGDLVRWNGTEVTAWNEDMVVLFDGKPRKVLSIESYDDDGTLLELEGVDSSDNKSTGMWAYRYENLELVDSIDDVLEISEEERNHHVTKNADAVREYEEDMVSFLKSLFGSLSDEED